MSDITRRDLLQVAAATAVGSSLGIETNAAEQASPASRTGAKIELYTNTLSAVAGDEVTVHVSTTAPRFTLEVARVGIEETVVWTRENLRGAFHPTPHDAWEKGCGWPVSVRLTIPASWKSGYYQIKARTKDEAAKASAESLAFVVVRAVRATSKILLVLATNTYAAYNNYGGASFYIKKATGKSDEHAFVCGEHRLSFQRPWMPGFLWKAEGSPRFYEDQDLDWWGLGIDKRSGYPVWSLFAGFHNWERTLVRWLEQNRYEVDYAISSDLEFHPDLLSRYRLMLSAGHDEYWSWGMRDTVESFVARGGNACFFSGNICFWQVRYEDQGNRMVCYKADYQDDPYFKAGKKNLTATCWSSHFIHRPETRMTGLSQLYAGFHKTWGVTPRGPGGYLIYRPEHWVFKDSEITYGDLLGQASSIVHYEVDGCPIRMEGGLPYPGADYDGPSSLEILGMIPAGWQQAVPVSKLAEQIFGNADPKTLARMSHKGHAVMSMYTTKGTVFCAGTTDWVMGLTGKDPAVERVTKNLLDRLSA